MSQNFSLVYVCESSREAERLYGARLRRLIAEGFEVHLVAGDDGGFSELEFAGVRARPIPTGNAASYAGAFFLLQSHLIEHRPVLVHGFGAPWAWMAAFAATQIDAAARIATIEHHSFEARRNLLPALPVAPWLLAARQKSYRWLGEHVDAYVVTHERDYRALQAGGIVAPGKLEVAVGGRGVDLEIYDVAKEASDSPTEVRRTLELPSDWRQVLGYAGPIAPVADELLRLIDALFRTHPRLGWLLVEEELPKRLRRRFDRLVASGRVRFVSSDDAHFYRALDLYVSPLSDDTAGEELMRAAAMRTPVVARDSAAAASVVVDHETGRLAPASRPDALKQVLDEVLIDPRRMSDYGIRARARAEETLDRRQVDEQILRLYDRILSSRL